MKEFDNGQTTCEVCEKRNAKNLKPMTVFEPQTKKTFELERVCPKCQKILEKNPNRVLFVIGKLCQSCKMPYGLRVMNDVVKGPRTITHQGKKFQVCKVCKKLINKEVKSGAEEEIAKIGKLISTRTKRINIMSEENKRTRKVNSEIRKKNKERRKRGQEPLTLLVRKHSTKKMDKIRTKKESLTKHLYQFAICHLRLSK